MKILRFISFYPLLLLPFFSCCSHGHGTGGVGGAVGEAIGDAINNATDALLYPKELKVDGNTYIHDFYDNDMLHNCYRGTQSEKAGKSGKKFCYSPQHPSLHLMAYADGENSTTEGNPLYCLKSEKSQAESYYANGSSHWNYYLDTGTDASDRVPRELTGVDTGKFDKLIKFCRENSYEPFGTTKNAVIKKEDYPMPDGKLTEYHFYKQSDDGLLCSIKGYTMHIYGGRLYLVYAYDFDRQHGGAGAKMQLVALPSDIEPYFRSLVN